jgi:hypothetical protein
MVGVWSLNTTAVLVMESAEAVGLMPTSVNPVRKSGNLQKAIILKCYDL